MKKLSIIFLIILFSVKIIPQIEDSGLESIKSDELLRTVKILASAKFDGRLPGSEGYNKAAQFAADKFYELGLWYAGDEQYFHYLNVEYNKIDSPAVFKTIVDGDTVNGVIGKDFVLRGFTGSNSFTLPVVFCGYGISRPDLHYDDYAGINVKNKIVMVFKQNPKWKNDDKDWGTNYPREKSLVAKKHGAKGILFISLPNDEKPQPLIGSVMHGEGEQPVDFPQLHISLDAANTLLSKTGFSISDCQTKIDEKKKPLSMNLTTKAHIEVNASYEKNARTMNVVAMLEGNDPKLKEEYVIIGAHLDHVGSQAGLLFPGANDNASGSAGVLEIAKAFVKGGIQHKRSVIFVLFASEEQGLNGAKHFVESWKKGYDKIIAMINLDSVGYGDSIQVGNGKSSPELWNLARKIDKENLNLMVEETWSGGGADLTPFYEKGIPGLYFVSKHSYDHLHLPTDTPETLNKVLIEKIVKLAYLTAQEVAYGNYNRETLTK
ncbi:MAG TPA: M20/M25/M40 family metallo-hydrolase [Ignavibacteriaceae bacterium]|nr:M20/M25/M40 family metallo-hydrolase [Ignavibacteriaceae bacterium]